MGGPGTRFAVNGKPSSVALRPGSFVTVRQTWKNGDRLEFTLDRPFRLAQSTRNIRMMSLYCKVRCAVCGE